MYYIISFVRECTSIQFTTMIYVGKVKIFNYHSYGIYFSAQSSERLITSFRAAITLQFIFCRAACVAFENISTTANIRH